MKNKNNLDGNTLFIILSSILCASTILLNIYCMKILSFKNTVFGDGGLTISWIIFLSSNLITKNFGEKTAINVIKVSNCISIFVSVLSQILVVLPVPTDYIDQNNAFSLIFSSSLRIIISSNIAYFVGNIIYIKLISKNKDNIFSSILGQTIDNFLFSFLAFAPIGLTEYEIKIIDIFKIVTIGTLIEASIERIVLRIFIPLIQNSIKKIKNEI